MLDIFVQKEVSKLFTNKTIVFMGDSNIRALYKDLLCLSQQTKFIPQKVLKTKMEDSCLGDKLMTHGPKTNGRSYREERLAFVNNSKISFYFLTCVYDNYVQEVLSYISLKSNLPDVLILNSVLWDVTRWGPKGVELFKENLVKLMKELKRLLPDCLIIWVTAPPIACEVKGGFLVKELEFLKYSLRFHVMEANNYARKVVVNHGFDILDSHYHLKMQIHRRSDDGIHWMPNAVRYVTNLLLTHISIAWNVPLPQRYKSDMTVETPECIQESAPAKEHNNIKNEPIPTIASVIQKPSNSVISPERIVKIKAKENLKTKTPKKKKKSGNQRNSRYQESHHSYLSRTKKRERNKRIRNWQSTALLNTPPKTVGRFPDPCDNGISFDSQHDSGYFPSPQETPLLYTPYFQPSNYSNYNYPYSYQQNFSSFPDFVNNNRQVIISSNARYLPYPFPNFNTQISQINFTCNVPFGIRFDK